MNDAKTLMEGDHDSCFSTSPEPAMGDGEDGGTTCCHFINCSPRLRGPGELEAARNSAMWRNDLQVIAPWGGFGQSGEWYFSMTCPSHTGSGHTGKRWGGILESVLQERCGHKEQALVDRCRVWSCEEQRPRQRPMTGMGRMMLHMCRTS